MNQLTYYWHCCIYYCKVWMHSNSFCDVLAFNVFTVKNKNRQYDNILRPPLKYFEKNCELSVENAQSLLKYF